MNKCAFVLHTVCNIAWKGLGKIRVFFSVWRVLTLADVTAFGDRAFSTAGPLVWNYLPTDLSVSSGALNSTHSLTSDSHGLYIQPF